MTAQMGPGTLATSRHESAEFLVAGRNRLVALHTAPASNPNGIGVVLLHGGNYRWSAHRNQLFTRIARRLAASGFHAIRFDYHGIGDSTGMAEEFRMDRPFTEDTMSAVRWLRTRGVDRFIVVGECFGARSGLAAAAEIEGLVGLFLIAPPMRDGRQSEAPRKLARKHATTKYLRQGLSLRALRRLGNPVARRALQRLAAAKLTYLTRRFRRGVAAGADADVSSTLLDQMEGVVARGVRIHFVFGTRDGIENFESARRDRLGEILARGGDAIEVTVLEGRVHAALTRVDTQDTIYDLIVRWAPEVAVGAAD